MPPDFLKTFNSYTNFSTVMVKIKRGSTSDAEVPFTRDECRALLWGLQLLATGDFVRRDASDG